MKYVPVALLIVSSTTCMNPQACAFPEEGLAVEELNPDVVSTTNVASDISVVKNDFALMEYRPPSVVHGPAYCPAWQAGAFRVSRWFEYLREGCIFFHERDGDT